MSHFPSATINIGRCLQRSVHVIKPEVQEEWAILILFDECLSFIRQSFGEVFPIRTVIEPRIPIGTEITASGFVALRLSHFPSATINIESLILRPIFFGFTQMPFPQMGRAVTRIVQRFGQRVGIGR